MLSQLLLIMVSYAEKVVLDHGDYAGLEGVKRSELCWASGYESWCVMLSQWLWIMVCDVEPVVVNQGV
jgi:hypothetical protein